VAIELFDDDAPNTVANSTTKLSKDGFYDGLTFYRVIAPGFMGPEGGRPNTRAGAI